MRNIIKTEHFIYRQWDRNVCENAVNIMSLNATPSKHVVKLVAFPHFLKRMCGITTNRCLVFIIKGSALITCYWRDINEIMFSKNFNRNVEVQSLQ